MSWIQVILIVGLVLMGFLAWLVLRQAPRDAMLYRKNFHTYWYIPA